MSADDTQRTEILERLSVDTLFYAENVAKIVNKAADLVPVVPRPAQLKVEAALEAQRKAGLPERVIVLKSRQTGISTWVQIKLMQRASLRPNRRCLVVAHDNDTAVSLFDIGKTVYEQLPGELPEIKPPIANMRDSDEVKMIRFAERARAARLAGQSGLNSILRIDTAKEATKGRGKTITDLHCSEVAFWPYPDKVLSLMNAVPDQPGTIVVLESTANGNNFFKQRWERAEKGESEYTPVFIGWPEDPDCSRSFPTPEARVDFLATIGTGDYGEDEQRLIDRFGATPEQLYWRRLTIADKCDGDVNKFKQEYPSSPGEAFIGSGNHVFAFAYIQKVLDRVEHTDPPAVGLEVPVLGDGLLLPSGVVERKVRDGTVEVPTGTLWVPRSATGFDDRKDFWRIWEHPDAGSSDGEEPREPGQYVIANDVAGGEEETSTGDTAYHAIQVINHHTLEQVAQWRSRCDPDLLPLELFLVGMYYNEALVAVETTGHWGTPVVTALWRRLGYRRLYRRKAKGTRDEKTQELLGWDTNRRTKPHLETSFREQLREGTHGIRSKALAFELTSYVKDERGRSGPDTDAFSDLLMAYMIGQYIAAEHRPRAPRKKSTPGRGWTPRNPITGY